MIYQLALIISLAVVSESKDIPLQSIWAWDMPETKKVREIDPVDSTLPKSERIAKSPSDSIVASLNNRDKKFVENPMQGFVVMGSGKVALENASNVLSGKTKPPEDLPHGQEISVVFFSKPFGRQVRIDKVTRDRTKISISYHFHSKVSMGMSANFAVIPLGKLSKGGYKVRIRQNPNTAERGANISSVHQVYVNQTVCRSFEFNVWNIPRGG